MVVITSFSRALYDAYARRVIGSFDNWPEEARLIVYTEDMPTGNEGKRIEWRRLEFPDLTAFKERCPPNPPDYTKDAARFANKVWAMTEGSMNESGLCFWLDADCITYRKLSADYLNRLIPKSYYMGSFERPSYVETGLWGVRADHEHHKHFMRTLKSVYTSDLIFRMSQWHDCFALDYVRNEFEDKKLIRAVNWTETLNGRGTHVMATSEIGRWIDHTKGERKQLGYSPENRWHAGLHRGSAVLGVSE
jgi:hypothetical protein